VATRVPGTQHHAYVLLLLDVVPAVLQQNLEGVHQWAINRLLQKSVLAQEPIRVIFEHKPFHFIPSLCILPLSLHLSVKGIARLAYALIGELVQTQRVNPRHYCDQRLHIYVRAPPKLMIGVLDS
jgi:hypothetical protein